MNCLANRKKFKSKHPAWEDPSEEQLKQPIKLVDDEPQDDDEDSSSSEDDDDYELVAGEVRSKTIKLETKELKYKHLTNINNDRSYTGAVTRVQFHPTSKMALVTLSRGQVDLYEVDGERNRYIQNIKLPWAKKPFCSFQLDGNSVVISSENYRGRFYTYDMVNESIKPYSLKAGGEVREMTDFQLSDKYMGCRKDGSSEIQVLDSKTYENLFTLRLNEPAKSLQFTAKNELYVAGENSRVYIWDLRKTSICKHRFQDEGTVHATSMSITETSKMLSIGSDCGVVNSYDLDTCSTEKYPTPVRTFTNLKESIDILRYNHSGELLLMGSSQQSEGFRMAHSHSGIVYKNFPVQQKKYGHLLGMDFSPLSGYLSLGCSNGRAFLCRIPYYKSY